MKSIVKIIPFIFVVIIPVSLNAQKGKCSRAERFCSPAPKSEGFIHSGQSAWGELIQGDTSEVSIVIYKNMDYRLFLCSSSKSLNGNITFQIIEKTRKGYWKEVTVYEDESVFNSNTGENETKKIKKTIKKRAFREEEVIKYDNSKYEFNPEFIFSSEKTRNLIIRVFTPKVDDNLNPEEVGGNPMSCVGLLVEQKQTEKLRDGFVKVSGK